jgi:hypothetical protein
MSKTARTDVVITQMMKDHRLLEDDGVRINNPSERVVYDHLRSLGYRVLKRGWPDFLAYRVHPTFDLRFVEVKPPGLYLKPIQRQMANPLSKVSGIDVELATPHKLPDATTSKMRIQMAAQRLALSRDVLIEAIEAGLSDGMSLSEIASVIAASGIHRKDFEGLPL